MRMLSISYASRAASSTLSTPQARFTAVGLVALMTLPILRNSSSSFSMEPALLRAAARAMPNPPAAPSAGAPRTLSDEIASVREAMLSHSMTLYSTGSRVWSIITMVLFSLFQSMVLNLFSRPVRINVKCICLAHTQFLPE